MTTPVTIVVNRTRPIASKKIGRKLALNSCHEVNHAAAYNSGGRKQRNTSSGLIRSTGKPGTKLMHNPPITSAIGYGTLARPPRSTTATTAPNNRTSTSTGFKLVIIFGDAASKRKFGYGVPPLGVTMQ